jgi:hypothetical protein
MHAKVSATFLRAVIVSLFFTACGGGTKVKDVVDKSEGNSNTTASIPPDPTPTEPASKPPEVVRSVTSESITPVRSARGSSRTDIPVFDVNADYVVDGVSAWNYDVTVQSLADINNLLCVLDQTNFVKARQVGQSQYCAWVDLTQCQAGTVGDATDLASTAFQAWAVRFDSGSAEPTGEDPLNLTFWGQKWILDAQQNKQLVDVFGTLSVESHVTSVYPNGLYHLHATYTNHQNQKAVSRVDVTTPDNEKTHILYSYIDPYGRKTNAAFERDSLGVYGSGTVSYKASAGQQTPTVFTYTHDAETYVRKSTDNAFNCNDGVCVGSRETLDSTVWRYSLYNDQGQRVQPTLPVSYVLNYSGSGDRSTWTLGVDDGTGLKITQGSIGSSINTLHYDTYQPNAVGAMVDHFIHAKGILWRLEKSIVSKASLHAWDLSFALEGETYWVRYNKEEDVFERYAQWNDGTDLWEALPVTTVDVSEGILTRIRDKAYITLDGENSVVETVSRVRAGDVLRNISLVCTADCLDATKVNDADPYHTGTGVVMYVFDKATMTLKEGNAVVVKNAGNIAPVVTGRMHDPEDSPNVSYMWLTGQRLADQSVHVLTADNKDVVGGAPLHFLHMQEETTAFLTYAGPGLLYGIPTSCVHKVTNQSVTCSNQAARKIPAYNIADGTGLFADGVWYYVRSVGVEERIRMQAASGDGVEDPVSDVSLGQEVTLADAQTPSAMPDVCTEIGVVGGVTSGDMCMGHGHPHIE